MSEYNNIISSVVPEQESDEVSKFLDEPVSPWDEKDVFGAELHRIARLCILNNWFRTDWSDGGWHYFTKKELDEINSRTGNGFDSGYCFLDEDGGTDGLIRLWQGHALNPKWSFWMESGSLKLDWA